MRLFLIGLAALTLGACGEASDEATAPAGNEAMIADGLNATANSAETIDHGAAIAKLSDTEQQGVFLRAIRDADLPCRDVNEVVSLEPEHGIPMWRAQCEQGEAYLISVKPDGSAQITSRRTS